MKKRILKKSIRYYFHLVIFTTLLVIFNTYNFNILLEMIILLADSILIVDELQ